MTKQLHALVMPQTLTVSLKDFILLSCHKHLLCHSRTSYFCHAMNTYCVTQGLHTSVMPQTLTVSLKDFIFLSCHEHLLCHSRTSYFCHATNTVSLKDFILLSCHKHLLCHSRTSYFCHATSTYCVTQGLHATVMPQTLRPWLSHFLIPSCDYHIMTQ